MSMICCDRCDKFIDSDDDPGCFVEVPWLNLDERIWCEDCRESEWLDWEEEQMQMSLCMTEAEKRDVDNRQ